jgi:hypothetical protein
MRAGRVIFVICLAAVALMTTAGLATVRASKVRLELAAEEQRARLEEARRIREQESLRAACAPTAAPGDPRVAAWQGEAEQLAREIDALRRETAARDAAAQAPQKLPPSALAATPRAGNPWENAGRAAPLATFQTVQWAIHAGDVDVLESAVALDPAAETAAQQFFDSLDPESRAEFRSPQRLVASAMAAKSRSDITAAQVVGETVETDGTRTVRLSLARSRGAAREITMRFQPSAEGWRLEVPAKIVTSYRNLLLGPVIDPKTYKVVR